uniref:Peroxisomal membrane protein n=1 Tax=Rhizophora mucronata TaxID=61149 RepID=A0A2P2MUD5_RHIMU
MTLVWYLKLLNIVAFPSVEVSGLRWPAKKGSIIKITATVAPRYLTKKS